jgi:Ca-activated chloride channel family protein
MILDPVAPLWVLGAAGAVLVTFAAWRLARSRVAPERLGWALRILAVLLLLVVAARPVIPADSVQRARTSWSTPRAAWRPKTGRMARRASTG